jgi:hypothetical protein
MQGYCVAVGVIVAVFISSSALAGTKTFTEGYEGWGSSTTFDFTQIRTSGGTDYFGWDPLEIDASFSGGQFVFDISMPRALTGGDNFDLVIDWDNDGVDSDGDFLVHYANNGSSAGGGWDGVWDAKSYSGNWQHIGGDGLDDLTQTTISASTSDQRNFEISFAGSNDITYQWLSPLGDEGFPESWAGEAVVISSWDGADPDTNTAVAVPLPAAAWAGMALLGGMGGVAGLRRKLRRA